RARRRNFDDGARPVETVVKTECIAHVTHYRHVMVLRGLTQPVGVKWRGPKRRGKPRKRGWDLGAPVSPTLKGLCGNIPPVLVPEGPSRLAQEFIPGKGLRASGLVPEARLRF